MKKRPLYCLFVVMKSKAARDFLRANRRSNIHLYPDDWKKLPIPEATMGQQAPLIRLVDQILTSKRTDPHADVTAIEQELDILVSQLYGLHQNQSVDKEKQHGCS